MESSLKTPVSIVDDSTMARKMLIKALPQDWNIEIHQGSNGEEGLELYRQGKAEIMFLDLQMPVLDGYQTLETIRQEGMNCFVIVVSADIQPDAEKIVKNMGAIAFVKKPVDPVLIKMILDQYGVTI